jgi:uncharacterized protein YdiU (UPF0061 family)
MKKLEQTYIQNSEHFFKNASSFPIDDLSKVKLIYFNENCAKELGLEFSSTFPEHPAPHELKFFCGSKFDPEQPDPVALSYSGHQFGHFSPTLGDGRALLMGEVLNDKGVRYDIHLKGSGRTAFSRGGDGFAPLKAVLREILVSEFMYQCQIPTTRSLAGVETGLTLFRQGPYPQKAGVLTRVAQSHIRIGTFEYLASRGLIQDLKKLLDHTIQRHYSHLITENDEVEKIFKFFHEVCERQIQLIAKWMGLGFIHGVMNTDNMLLSGETIDYGPCAFMDHFNINQVYSSIDHNGRYNYSRQPAIALWNLAQLARTLIPIVVEVSKKDLLWAQEKLQNIINFWSDQSEIAIHDTFVKKMGLGENLNLDKETKKQITTLFLTYLDHHHLDFTLSFQNLPQLLTKNQNDFFPKSTQLDEFIKIWSPLIKGGHDKFDIKIKENNPYIIPRNHIVEKILNECEEDNFTNFQLLMTAFKNPFERHSQIPTDFLNPPKEHEVVKATFCGT